MTLLDAAHALDELASGRVPDIEQAMRGFFPWIPCSLLSATEQFLHEAAATLELLVATGGTANLFASSRLRAGAMADAVRQVIEHG